MKLLLMKKRYLGYFLICISLFIFTSLLRKKLFLNFDINILFYLGFILMIKSKVFIKPLSNKDNTFIGKIVYLLLFILSSILLLTIRDSGWNTISIFKSVFYFVFPSLILYSKINKSDEKTIIKIWYNVYRIVTYSLIIMFIVDKILGNQIQNFIVNFYDNSVLRSLLNNNRFISFYGHPLTNANFFLFFLIFVFVIKYCQLDFIKKNYILDIFMAVIGILITGSKSAFIISLVVLFISLANRENFKYIIIISIFIMFLYYIGILDTTLNRLHVGLETGDISTSRNVVLKKLLENDIINFKFLSGHPIGNDSRLIIALEYPILRWAYRNGVLVTIVFLIMYFIHPIFLFIKKRKWRVLILALCYMLYVNGEDSIASFGDALIIYSFNILMLYTLSNYDTRLKKCEKG